MDTVGDPPAPAPGLILDGIGEMVGYAFGVSDSGQKLADLELHRRRHVVGRDSRQVPGT